MKNSNNYIYTLFLNKKSTMLEFSELIIVISVGEFRYRFITFSKYPKANGFSAAEVPFDSSICYDILRNVSLCVRWCNFNSAFDATEFPDGTDKS